MYAMACKVIGEVMFQLDFEVQTVILIILSYFWLASDPCLLCEIFFIIDFKQIIMKRI